jgi:carboxymethylenebutenolidase
MRPESLPTSDVIGLTKTAPLSRRGFMTASAAVAAGYTLAAGPVRADVIKTDTNGLTAGDARIKVADGEMPGYFARPANAANPPVVLVAMEIFGLHEYIRDVTRRLAKLGAFAVAPDYYFRKGDLTRITDIPQLLPMVNAKPDAELLSDLDSTVAWAKSQGADTSRLGIIGFCRGRPHGVGICRPQPGPEGGRRVLRSAGRSAQPSLAEEPYATGAGNEGCGDRALWRGR